MSRAIRLLVVLFLTANSVSPQSARAEDQLTSADKQAIAWFDGLSFPNFAHAKCVRVTTGEWSKVGDEPAQNRFILAFLLSEQGDSFTVFTLDLLTRTFTKTPPETPDHARVAFEYADLAGEADKQLQQLAAPKSDEDHWRRFGETISERVEVFTLGRACAAQELDDLAHRLMTAAAAMPSRDYGDVAQVHGLRSALAAEIGHAMMWRAILAFGEPSISRQELLTTFHSLLKHFPTSEHAKRAQETADLLAKMVEEDKQHANEQRKAVDQLSTRERVAEFIFQLRDQNGQQWSQPGSCDIFLDPRGEESPAAQLRKIGFDTVPQLIEVVNDQRFTRSVGYHRDFYFSHHVLRVGDCAELIIEDIAGRSFYNPTYTSTAMLKDGEADAVKRDMQEWWGEIQKKGEKQVLCEAVARGDDRAYYQARRLAEKYPQATLEPIRQGITASQEEWVRTGLVEIASGLKGEAVVELLLQEMSIAPNLSTRVSAAQGLLARGRDESVIAMIREWQRLEESNLVGDVGGLIGFLAQSGKPDAIRALSDSLARRPVYMRFDVVAAFGEGTGSVALFTTGPGVGFGPSAKHQVLTPEAESILEELLISALTDTAERVGISGSWDGLSISDPRICDIAAHVLSVRFKDKYKFDYFANLSQRNRQLVELQNVWREEHSLEAMPLPTPRTNSGLPAERTQPLLTRVASARTPMDREQSLSELERLGLPALPTIRAFQDALDSDHPARADLALLAARLANVVMETVIQPNDATTDISLMRRLASIQNKQLTAAGFVTLLQDTARELPKDAKGVTVTAYRFDNNTGVLLTLTLSKEAVHQEGTQKGWSRHERVEVGKKNIHNSFGTAYALTAESHEELAKNVEKALKAPPSDSFVIRASLQLEQ